jgi:ABC-2 type transport system permease protein
VTLEGQLPSVEYHLLLLLYSGIVVLIGVWIYKKNRQKYAYYM